MNGYSDRINHALAFAAKHHDRQVRKGTRLPYITHAANVALILTRYGCDETTGDRRDPPRRSRGLRPRWWTHAMLESADRRKFGNDVLTMVLAVSSATRR